MPALPPHNQRSPVGYTALMEKYELRVLPHWCSSYIHPRGRRTTDIEDGRLIQLFTPRHHPGDSLGDHLEFALKHEGLNLNLMAALFERTNPVELERHIAAKPMGQYARQIWFLYEWLTGRLLNLPELKSVKYVDLLNPEMYYTATPLPSPRHKVNDNLSGHRLFCPLIRRTARLAEMEARRLNEQCAALMKKYPEDAMARAMNYLYAKETKSSFAIERVSPSTSRVARFVSLLHRAESGDYLNKSAAVALQKEIVEARFASDDYRASQNYVGESPGAGRGEIIHYVCPKPEDVGDLMEGLWICARRIVSSGVHPVIAAAAISFGFVFIHPFDDGNGRLHRFLLHHVLSRMGFTPPGAIFPVSATMLRHVRGYSEMLESYSKPLLTLLDYDLDDHGHMQVKGSTRRHYQFIDMTAFAEKLFEYIEQTIIQEIEPEIQFLQLYDKARSAILDVVDMPDDKINLFIKLWLQNKGRLSKSKQVSQFAQLTDDEVATMHDGLTSVYSGSPLLE